MNIGDEFARPKAARARRFRLAALTLVVLSMLVACGDPTVSQEVFDEASAERDSLSRELDEAAETVKSLESRLTELEQERTDTLLELDETKALLEAEAARADAAEDAAEVAREEVESLRLRYDDEIRFELQTAYNNEVERACQEAIERWDAPLSSVVNWDQSWEPVASEGDLMAAVEACSSEDRSKTAEQREVDRLASCSSIEVDALEKDPDRYTGDCIHMWARISQFDANTGVCSFRAEMSARRSTSWLDFDGNAIFTSQSDSDCPQLDGIDGDDYIEVWATGAGTLTYDTTIGGSATATLWRIEKVELVQKD